jgi:hypothetical protein
MRRIFIFIFVIQFATGHNLLVELLRLPSLMEHFIEHKAENSAMTVSEFLWLHYADETHHEADSKHEKLPMHCHADHAITSIFIFKNIDFLTLSQTITTPFFEEKSIFFFSNQLISNYLANILQPPQ